MRHERYEAMQAAGKTLAEILDAYERDLILFLAQIEDEFETDGEYET